MDEGSYASGASTFPLMGMTIGEMVDSIAEKYPDTDAVVSMHQDIRWTYREFQEKVNTVARGLMGMGVDKGNRVGIWAMNHAEWVVVQFATAKIGAIMVNINPAYRTYELEFVLKQSEVSTLIIQGRFKTSDYVGMFYEACPEAFESKPGKISSEKFPFLKNVIFLGDTVYNGMFSWEDLMKRAEEINSDELIERSESLTFDDPINIQYTSGTTGFPKGVVLTHHSILNNGYIIGEGMGFTEKDRLCIPVPFYHCFGMVLSNLACVTHGSTMVLPGPAFDAEQVLRTIEKERCTAVHGVPTMFIAELAHPNFSKYNLKTLRTGIMAGSPCPIDVMKEVNTRMNMSEIVIVYGQTETAPGVTMTTTKDPVERRVTTVGRAFPHTELKIIDPASGKIVPTGEIGEICARGYCVMKCYYNNPAATACNARQGPLEPYRRPRYHGQGGLLQDRRPVEGHGDPGRREHLPAGDRGIPAPPREDRRCVRGRSAGHQVRRGTLRMGEDEGGPDHDRAGRQGLLQGQDRPLQDPAVRDVCLRLPHHDLR